MLFHAARISSSFMIAETHAGDTCAMDAADWLRSILGKWLFRNPLLGDHPGSHSRIHAPRE
jgi:hypothetical protein